MDFYTKMFVINLVIVFAIGWADGYFFDDYLDGDDIWGNLWGFWCLASIISIPAWLIYLIATW